ncbi:MAG: hypothetical protein ISS70_09555 [Phycisphaerae bacterium]|nr:hypothetical protein [Phycisphaerae bacterium]
MNNDEKHFNELQQKTRAIASTWILAGFGAIAYFIKTNTPVFEYFSTYTMINLVSLMVVVGLFVLWVLDQLVYQRLLNANFVAGLYKEYTDNRVAPIRIMMVIGSEYKGMARWYNLFYFIPMLTFTLFSSASWIFELVTVGLAEKTSFASAIIGIILILITTLIWKYIYSKKRETPFLNLLKSFDDKEFERIGSSEKCAEIIQKWDPT